MMMNKIFYKYNKQRRNKQRRQSIFNAAGIPNQAVHIRHFISGDTIRVAMGFRTEQR